MGLNLPEAFIKRMKEKKGFASDQFFKALEGQTPVSIRKNPGRIFDTSYLPLGEQVPWESDAFYLSERPSFTYDPSFHAGAYYVQEASSMLVGKVLDQISEKEKWSLVMDLCAAPGGKSTHLLSKLSLSTLVLANEVTSARLGSLRQNMIKWGYSNVAVTSYSVEQIARTGLQSDLLLLDAPCSGEGLFRKDKESISHWNHSNLEKCEVRQRDILQYAPSLVREGGYLIYSTCTYNPGENIEQIQNCIENGYFESIQLDFESSWGVETIDEGGSLGYQCYPHRVRGEGFFISLLKRTSKPAEIQGNKKALPDSSFRSLSRDEKNNLPDFLNKYADQLLLDKEENYYFQPESATDISGLINIRPLFELGQKKGKDFIPAHGLAMLIEFKEVYPHLELSYDDAIRFLKKETITFDVNHRKGWHFVTYKGNNIGIVKVLDNRINNYLPTNLRILK